MLLLLLIRNDSLNLIAVVRWEGVKSSTLTISRSAGLKRVPQGLKPSLSAAQCGTAEAVPFVRSHATFSAEVVPFFLHFSTPTWFRNPGFQRQLVQ